MMKRQWEGAVEDGGWSECVREGERGGGREGGVSQGEKGGGKGEISRE